MRPLAKLAAFHSSSADYLVDEMLEANPLPRRRSAWETVTDAFWGYQGLDGLQEIGASAYVVHGPADRIVPIEQAQVTAQLLPQGRFFELEQSGHAAPVEQAASYNRLLEQLLALT
jgi:pimeloyl-ACP methyl ester carboxylesterase